MPDDPLRSLADITQTIHLLDTRLHSLWEELRRDRKRSLETRNKAEAIDHRLSEMEKLYGRTFPDWYYRLMGEE